MDLIGENVWAYGCARTQMKRGIFVLLGLGHLGLNVLDL